MTMRLLALIPLLCLLLSGCGRSSDADELETYWPVPEFTLTNHHGQPFGKKDLAGKTWIVTLFFTECRGPCPMMTARLKTIQNAVQDPNVEIVSISCDPENDTVEKLQEYITARNINDNRWTFLTGKLEDVQALADGLKLSMEAARDGGEPGHSTRFLLVDRAGDVRGIYSTEEDVSMATLALDAKKLAERKTTPKEIFAAVNSGLNGLSALLLIVGYVFVRRKMWYAHGTTMSLAFLSSAAFLGCYLYSKFAYGEMSTGMPAGWFQTMYFIVLFPHVLLAILMLPMIFLTLYRAARRDWARHRRIARPTWGIWLYVSVTGILIYFILYHWYPALYPDAFRASPLFTGKGT